MLDEEDIKKLQLKKDDLVIVEVPSNSSSKRIRDIMDSLRHIKQKLNMNNQFLVIRGDVEIDSLSEEDMNAHGWYKLTEEEKKVLEKV